MPTNESKRRRWGRRLLGAGYLLGGAALALLATVMLAFWAKGEYAYRVPHACAHLECLHGVAVAGDGRTHCAENPPEDLARGEAGAAFRKRHAQGVMSVVGALALALYVVTSGWRWLRSAGASDRSWYQLAVRVVAPLAAALLIVQACVLLVPY